MSALSINSIQNIDSKLLQWEKAALRQGLTQPEVKRQNAFIRAELQKWIGNWAEESRNTYVKNSAEGPARAVEFLVNGTQLRVITHCKQKGGLSPMGSGFQSLVKTSILTLAFGSTLQAGSLIADKVPKKNEAFELSKKAIQREGQFLAQLRDAKHIRQLVAGVEDRDNKAGILLVAMQATLKEILYESFGLDHYKKISIAKDLISGLKEMRSKKIVHGDLHTDNCALSYEGSWMIHDFGFAQYEGDTIPAGSPINIYTSSPKTLKERFIYKQNTACSADDAWALGIILYEIDAGHKPDFHKKQIQIVEAVEKQDQTALQAAYDEYALAEEKFTATLKTSDLLLRDVIFDLMSNNNLERCLERVVALEEDEKENQEAVKPSESTEDLTGYYSAEQLSKLFP